MQKLEINAITPSRFYQGFGIVSHPFSGIKRLLLPFCFNTFVYVYIIANLSARTLSTGLYDFIINLVIY